MQPLVRMSVVGVLFACCLTTTEAASWRAGVAKTVITPSKPMPMAGYASRGSKHATGTLVDLHAKALAIEDGAGQRSVLITLDLVGIERVLATGIRTAIATELKLPLANVVLNCSHTHTGPVVAKNLRPMHYEMLEEPDRQLINEYAADLEQQVQAAARNAMAALAPADLLVGAGTATFATNRRNNKEADVPALRASGELKGPYDHSVPVLAIRREDKLIGVVFGYACHCTVLSSMEWSGDYAGFAQLDVEAAHPDCIAMFWAGCGADQNPLPRRTVELAREYGSELASSVNAVLAGELRPVSPILTATGDTIPLDYGPLPTREQLVTDSESTNPYIAARARAWLSKVDDGTGLPKSYPYPVTTWNLGNDVYWVFLGGEVVVDYALRIKAEAESPNHPDRQIWVAGYSQDVMAYIPSRRVLLEGGYEGATAMIYYGLPTVWSEQVEEQIMNEVQRQANPAAATTSQPPSDK